jgi:IS30 family transposase
VKQLCEVYQARKQRHISFPVKVEYQARRCLDLVHGDLCGPITPATPRGNKYLLLLVDDLSRYMWVAAIPSKDRATVAMKEIQARAEGEFDLKLRVLCTDRGGEFIVREFTEYYVIESVHYQHITPYNPQQNGVIERRNGTVVENHQEHAQGQGPSWMVLG